MPSSSIYSVSIPFKKGNVVDVVDAFKHLNSQVAYQPNMGPLPKTTYTYQYEALTRKLMNGEAFTCVQADDNTTRIQFKKGEEFNLTEIIAHANLDHLNFSQSDFTKYERYCSDTSQVQPQNEYGDYPTDEFFKKKDIMDSQ